MEIAALVSGGVDSSVTVHLLKEQGYDPTIFYIKIGMEDEHGYIDCPAEDDMVIVNWLATQKTGTDQAAHFQHLQSELQIVPGRDFSAGFLRDANQHLGFIASYSERFFQIDVAAGVGELWLIDVRGTEVVFQVFRRGAGRTTAGSDIQAEAAVNFFRPDTRSRSAALMIVLKSELFDRHLVEFYAPRLRGRGPAASAQGAACKVARTARSSRWIAASSLTRSPRAGASSPACASITSRPSADARAPSRERPPPARASRCVHVVPWSSRRARSRRRP